MKTKRYIFILFSVIFIFFASCNNTPIFSVIENEISLKKFSVEGNVLGLIEKDNNVYVANRAGVYVKNKDDEANWKEILTADRGIQKIASNSDNVFVCFESGNVKYYDESNEVWKDVPSTENIRVLYGDKTVFGYEENSGKIYKITKTGIDTVSIPGVSKLISAAGDYFLVKANNKIKLYKNGTEISGVPQNAIALCSYDNSNIFVLAGSTIYYYDSNWNNSISISKSPISISYFKERKTILLGSEKGYTEVKLNDATPTLLSNAQQINPGSSGSTTPPSSYSQYQTTLESYYTFPVLGVQRGSGDYAVFLGISSGIIQRNTGLWGFYSDKKREWNRE
ncbi:hypothetical protein E4O05_00170 [Treponema sp. OMZ 787]|uniref:hypothetical protein n=1 Tax=Treponema sp. OMZ 787 TaxID=2563669 RepID=UPI0020A3B660|nr:hypothetical protein [Treponema sp. OMZ 787]UTC62373.1 hypothetical protein E4O05_00170 [Treponema sp. OMZ 787]